MRRPNAEKLLDLGKILRHFNRCRCATCEKGLRVAEEDYPKEFLTIATYWEKAVGQDPKVGFVAIMDGWNFERTRDEVLNRFPELKQQKVA